MDLVRRLIFFVLSLAIINVQQVKAQTIDITDPVSIDICAPESFQIGVVNEENSTIDSTSITFILDCNISYIPGSVTGAAEVDISDLSMPVFAVKNLAPADSIAINIDININCEAKACAALGIIQHSIKVWSPFVNNVEYVSDLYNINIGKLVVVEVEDPLMSAAQNETITRKVTIRNTRLGKISQFELTDQHAEGISISMDKGSLINDDLVNHTILLDAKNFKQIGNQDGWFDFNEEISITETIKIITCPFDQQFIPSDLIVRWGCDSTICQGYTGKALIFVLTQADEGNVLKANPTLSHPECMDPTSIAHQKLQLEHTGIESKLQDLTVRIYNDAADYFVLENSATLNGVLGTITYEDAEMDGCGQNLYNNIIVTIDSVFPGEMISIGWDIGYCTAGGCGGLANTWEYEYNYTKYCAPPDDRYKSIPPKRVGDLDAGLISQDLLLTYNPPYLVKGDTAHIYHTFEGYNFTNTTGTLNLRYEIACNLEPIDQSFTMDGQTPVKNIIAGPINRILELSFQLPLTSNSLDLAFEAVLTCDTICIGPDCLTDPITSCLLPCAGGQEGTINYFVELLNDNCSPSTQIRACGKETFSYLCTSNTCPEIIPGYLDYSFETKRVNFGLPDNDNDHIPDVSGVIDPAKIAITHTIQGDTFSTRLMGKIVMDVPDTALSFGLITIAHEAGNYDFQGKNLDKMQVLEDIVGENGGFKEVFTKLKIYDKDENVIYSLSDIPYSYDPLELISYYDLDPLRLAEMNPGFPANFMYAQGDSVCFEKITLVDYNLISGNKGDGLWMDVNFSSKAQFDTKPIKPKSTFSCWCHESSIRLIGFTHWGDSNCCNNIEFCATKAHFSTDYRNLIVGEDQNLFPYEIRAPFTYESVVIAPTKNLLLDSALFYSYGNQLATLYPDLNNEIHYDFSDLPSKYFDEEINIRFESFGRRVPCSPTGQDTVNLSFLIVPRISNGYFDTLLKESISIVPENRPNLIASFEEQDLETESEFVFWDFIVTNSSSSVLSDFTWLLFPDLPPVVHIDSLVDTVTNKIFYPVDGIYQLGPLAYKDSLHLRLHATVKSCQAQTFTVRIGTQCETFEDPYASSCLTSNRLLTVTPLVGSVEMAITSDEQHIQLCDTSDYIQLTIYNADKGKLLQLITELDFPEGMTVIPSTSSIRYPATSGIWESISDPTLLNVNTYGWIWDTIAPQYFNEGLLGSTYNPFHGFDVRLKVTTDCSFTSGLKPQFATHGMLACGEPTEVLARVSGAIKVEDVDIENSISISKDTLYWTTCLDSIFVGTSLSTFDSLITEHDLFSVNLPKGYQYLQGSGFSDPEETDGMISWPLDTAVKVKSISFTLVSDGTDRCGNDFLSLFASSPAKAYCVSADTICTIEAVTGFAEFVIFNTKPIIYIKRFESIGQSNSLLGAELDLINIADSAASIVTVDLFLDINSDGEITLIDSLLDTQTHQIHIDSGQVITLVLDSIPLPDPFDACRIIASVSPDKNCICNADFQPINIKLQIVDSDTLLVCSGDTIDIGIVPKPGLRYRWTSDNLIVCDTCPITQFSDTNFGQNPIEKDLILQEIKDERCAIEHRFNIIIPPYPSIISPDLKICYADTIVLLSTMGNNIAWTGQNIISQELNQITAQPDSNGYYFASVIDTFGCSGIDSVYVKVLTEAKAIAGPDSLYCYGQTAYLSAEYNEGLNYQWINGAGILDNPSSYFTQIIDPTSYQTFILEVDNGLCQDYDTINISFYDAFDITGIPDSIAACYMDLIHLDVDGGQEYQWVPFYSDLCLNDSCSSVMLEVQPGLQEFYILGSTELGCKDTTYFEIYGDQDTLYLLDSMICDGESLFWKGYEITTSGTYCDTVYHEPCPDYTCLTVNVIERDTSHVSLRYCPFDTLIYRGIEYNTLGEYFFFGGRVGLCDSVIHLSIHEKGCYEADVYIPNVFTPNGDGINDLFKPEFESGYHIEILQFNIYDRWGSLVFHDITDRGWDGTFRGQKVDRSVYVYSLEITVNGAHHSYSGDVTLL